MDRMLPSAQAAPLTGMDGWVALPEIARLLGISPNAVSQRVRKYRLPTVALGRTHLVSLRMLLATYPQGGPRVVHGVNAVKGDAEDR